MANKLLGSGSWEILNTSQNDEVMAGGSWSMYYCPENDSSRKIFLSVSVSGSIGWDQYYGSPVSTVGRLSHGGDSAAIGRSGASFYTSHDNGGVTISAPDFGVSWGSYDVNVYGNIGGYPDGAGSIGIPSVSGPGVSVNAADPMAGQNCRVSFTIIDTLGEGGSYTVTRYYRAASSGTYSGMTVHTGIYTGVSSGLTVTDTVPANYAGYSVYYRVTAESLSGLSAAADSAKKNVASNSAPSVPASLTVPSSIAGGETFTVSWGSSTDADGNLAGYILERSLDRGASWALVVRGSMRSAQDTVPFGTETVTYRVRAYDTLGAESANRTQASPRAVTNNHAPSMPETIGVPGSALSGAAVVVTWGESTDEDGDAFEYVLERAADGAAVWTEIYRGGLRSCSDTAGAWQTVQYRVKAQDSRGASSEYRESTLIAVVSNAAPEISSDHEDGADLGVKSTVFSFGYSVSDANAADALTVKEIVDGTEKKSFTATADAEYTFCFRTGSDESTGYWERLLDGEHSVTISASDGKVTVTRTLIFTKSASGCVIELKNAVAATSGMVFGMAALAISGDVGEDRLTAVKVSSDGGSTWEDCVAKTTDTGYAAYGAKKASADNLNVGIGMCRMYLHRFTSEGGSFKYQITAEKNGTVGGWIGSVSFVLTEIAPGGTQAFDPDAGFPA